jgi:CarboxypepD_reg-like domain
MYFAHMKNQIILFITLLVCINVHAQSSFSISGSVINETTGMPMQGASVFAQNTTLGTVSNEAGKFTLTLPNGGYDLVISFTGFKTEVRRITTSDASDKVDIKLKEKEKELETVSIISSNEVRDGMEKYGQFFKDEFIGRTLNSKKCTIENPDVLHFFFSKKKNRLKITATEPLIIKNEALGYNIKYALDSFTHEYKTEVSVYSGFPLYENMQGDSIQNKQWQLARAIAYKGSTLHFMRSLYKKELSNELFEMQFIIKAYGKEETIKVKDIYAALNYTKDDSSQTVEILPNQPEVGILYVGAKPSALYLSENVNEPKDFIFSLLSFKVKESLLIEPNGFFYDQNDITISGYWAWEKVADQLPYDF